MDLKKFKLNVEGSFSITRPFESNQIVKHMEYFIKNSLSNYIITDATACMGGDLIQFSKHAKFVNGVEINPENFELLKENCRVSKYDNTNIICGNYLDLCDNLIQDIIYIDPPWSGPEYKNKEFIHLKLGDIDLWRIIEMIKHKKLAKYIFIKAPSNICLDNINYSYISIIYNKTRLPSFKLICIDV